MKNIGQQIETADLTIYPDTGRVEIDEEVVRLGPVNMKVLLVLVGNEGQLVSREELFQSVWKNQIVSDDTLTRCISDLRKKIAKRSKYKGLIVTIPKKGYVWNSDHSKKELQSSIDKPDQISPRIKKRMIQGLTAFLSASVLIFLISWVAQYYIDKRHVPIILLPFESAESHLQIVSSNIEESLRSSMLKTQNLRFLSNHLTSESTFKNLSTRYGVKWAIESRVRIIKGRPQITLSLVDANTALEVYSKSFESDGSMDSTNTICFEFIKYIDERLN